MIANNSFTISKYEMKISLLFLVGTSFTNYDIYKLQDPRT